MRRLVLRRFRFNKQTYVGFLRAKDFSGKIKIHLKNIYERNFTQGVNDLGR